MSKKLKGFKGKGTFSRGVHPPEQKHFSADAEIESVPNPKKVVLPLSQHIGAQCNPIVKPKQSVKQGELIAKSSGFISATLHTPVSGKIQKLIQTTMPNGRHVPAIAIKTEGDQIEGNNIWDEILGYTWPNDVACKYEPEEISNAIHDAGIVGLGGAAFPTHVKIMLQKKNPVDALLINGCECEPYLTSDYRLMREVPGAIITGAMLGGIATGAKDIVICIENNKPKAIEAVRKAAKGTRIKVAVVKTKYPQGSEKHLIRAVLDRIVPLGGLPADVGVTVSNVMTIAAVAQAVIHKKPLTHRIVCVTGGGIARPKNLFVPIGISYGDLIEFCGGLTKDAARIMSGGPMMGSAFTNLNMPVTKGTSGVTVLTHKDLIKEKETVCVRCGRCVDVCPMHLVPCRLALAARYNKPEIAEKYNIMGCMESGCCAYICPANIPLVQLIRTGKAIVAAHRKKS